MAFRSDIRQLRTWDPDSGWELRRIPTGPGVRQFELTHPTEERIRFQSEVLSVENIDQLTNDGRRMARIVYRVYNMDGRSPTEATPTERKLIEDALYAFGTIYNGPAGPVEVIFYE